MQQSLIAFTTPFETRSIISFDPLLLRGHRVLLWNKACSKPQVDEFGWVSKPNVAK